LRSRSCLRGTQASSGNDQSLEITQENLQRPQPETGWQGRDRGAERQGARAIAAVPFILPAYHPIFLPTCRPIASHVPAQPAGGTVTPFGHVARDKLAWYKRPIGGDILSPATP
jgi:hypothetical protein